MSKESLSYRLTRMFYGAVRIDTTALEFSIALQGVFFGAWLLLPIRSFEASTAFVIMEGIANEIVWGAVFLVLACVELWLLHLNNMCFKKFVMAIILALWLIVDISVWASGSTSTAGVVYLVTVFSAAWCVISITVRGG